MSSQKEGRGLLESDTISIEKSVTLRAGSPVTDIRKTAGVQLIETLNDQQGARLLMLKHIGETGVEVSPHCTLKAAKGVVVSHDLLNFTEEELSLIHI